MYDIITIGSASVDAFIETDSKRVEIMHRAMEDDICLPIGSKILIKKLEYDTGGGGTNTAVAFSRLGFKTGWIGKIGDDANSRHILNEMKKEHVAFLGRQTKGGTGFSVILIGIEKNRTILAYKGINDTLKWTDIKNKNAKWVYIGSMMGLSFKTTEKLALYAKKNKISYTFNPSTYLASKGLAFLKKILKRCQILVLNEEEAGLISKRKEIDSMLKKLQEYSRIVVITQGPKGAAAYDGETKYKLYPAKIKVVETTGAGDAFASGFTAGYILNKDVEYALRMGYAEASSVIEHLGAKRRLLTREQAENRILKKACRITKQRI